MTPEQQRIAIAEACGLIVKDVPIVPALIDVTRCYLTPRAFAEYRKAYPSGSIPRRLPDYPNDLNAMHEAEKALGPEAFLKYQEHLAFVVVTVDKLFSRASGPGNFVISATAAQRAEAFLRTIGKWNGDI